MSNNGLFQYENEMRTDVVSDVVTPIIHFLGSKIKTNFYVFILSSNTIEQTPF